jgi:hypothetical protein
MILGFAPRFDEATEISRRWFEDLSTKIDMRKTAPEEAVRERAEELVKELNPDTIVFYDHGVEDALIGNDKKPIFNMKNIKLLKGKTLYTMSCLSGRKLGVEHWRNGGVFWGYCDVFAFVIDEEELFREAANHGLIVRETLKLPWSRCFEEARRKFDELVKKAKTFWARVCLVHDKESLVCYDSSKPTPKCPLRRKLLRIVGWRPKHKIVGTILEWFGLGVLMHDFCHQLYVAGGLRGILSLQGGYVGFLIFVAGYIIEKKLYD